MTWVRLDDRMLDNDKIARLTPLAFAQFVGCILWCARNLTNGLVPARVVNRIFDWTGVAFDESSTPYDLDHEQAFSYNGWTAINTELLDAGLVHSVENADDCPSEVCQLGPRPSADSLLVHDYLVYNPSKDEVLAQRDEKHEAKVRAGKIRAASAARANGRFISRQPTSTPAYQPAVQTAGDTADEPPDQSAPATNQPAGDQQPASPVTRTPTTSTTINSPDALKLSSRMRELLHEKGIPTSSQQYAANHRYSDFVIRNKADGDVNEAIAILEWLFSPDSWHGQHGEFPQKMQKFHERYYQYRPKWQAAKQSQHDPAFDLPLMVLPPEEDE